LFQIKKRIKLRKGRDKMIYMQDDREPQYSRVLRIVCEVDD